MINNRQAGRRRGRNNPRPQGNGRSGDSGNRIDNRARGNAAQLLEKYKNLARDAQTQGDRVNAEYYLQFADHYFRVLADNRTRQEEQQPHRRPRDDNRYDSDDEFETGQAAQDGASEATDGDARDDDRQQDQGFRRGRFRNDRNVDTASARPERAPRPVREQTAQPAAEQPVAEMEESPAPAAKEAAPAPKRAVRARRTRKVEAPEEKGSMDAAILPPSISKADNDSGEEQAPAPRKRTRRTRPAAEAAE